VLLAARQKCRERVAMLLNDPQSGRASPYCQIMEEAAEEWLARRKKSKRKAQELAVDS
jgi:hypothetical protein